MSRDVASGSLLIAGAAAGVVVMGLHPTAHGLMNPESAAHLTQVNVLVHGLALAATPMVFLGLLGLWRRLAPSDPATAAVVVYGWGCVALMSAAVASGFVATGVIARLSDAEGGTTSGALLLYTGLWNQGFAKVNVVASSVGILLFGVSILRTRRLAPAAGVTGAIVGALILLLFFAGHLRLDVHGFGIVVVAQSIWLVWVGVLLCGAENLRAEPQTVSPSQ